MFSDVVTLICLAILQARFLSLVFPLLNLFFRCLLLFLTCFCGMFFDVVDGVDSVGVMSVVDPSSFCPSCNVFLFFSSFTF